MSERRRAAEVEVAHRFERAQEAGDLPIGWDPGILASYVMTVAAGIAVQAKSGMSKEDLIAVANMAMQIWPEPC